MGIDMQTQTEFRDSESQTLSADFVPPEPWLQAQPDRWVLAGCPASEIRVEVRSHDPKYDASHPLYSRQKSSTSFRCNRLVDPSEEKNHRKLDRPILKENCLIMDPFLSSSFKDLSDLEQCQTFRIATASAVSSPPILKSEEIPARISKNRMRTISPGPKKVIVVASSSRAQEEEYEEELSAKAGHRSYVAYLGKHRKVLTPRCDPSLLGRMERVNAVVLLQRCLRGRAAQITMAEMKSRVLHLYPEVNGFGDYVDKARKDTTAANAIEELNAVKPLVGDHLYELYLSLQSVQLSK